MFKKSKVKYFIMTFVLVFTLFISAIIFTSFDFKQQNSLVVGTSPDYPPLESKSKDGKLIGFDIDVVKELSKRMNVKVEFKEIGFDSLISAIQSNKIDMIASGFTNNPLRAKVVDFSNTYLKAGNAILSLGKKDDVNINTIVNSKVAVLSGTTQLDILKKLGCKNIKVFDNQGLAIKALQTSNADYAYLGEVTARNYAKNIQGIEVYSDKITPADNLAFALSKGHIMLKHNINKQIKLMESDNTLSKLSVKWFGHDIYK